jgi:hypothetical protein
MDIAELIWIFVIIFFLYRMFFAPAKQREQNRYDVPAEPPYEEEKSTTRTRDDILDEMRTIFGDTSTTRKTKPTPPPRPRPTQRSDTRQEFQAMRESRYGSYMGTDFIDSSRHMSEADQALKDVHFQSPGLIDRGKSKKPSFNFLYQHNELKKGIIISEILGKPKSLRRYNV